MSIQTDDTSADTFWPGYVDAVTNLVLNLLFVVLIMTVAVFVLALEMGRQQIAPPVAAPEVTPVPQEAPPATSEALQAEIGRLKGQLTSLQMKEAQVRALENKLQALEKESKQKSGTASQREKDAQKNATDGQRNAPSADGSGGITEAPTTVIPATSTPRIPERSLEKVAPGASGGGILVKFADDAIALTREETDELRRALTPIVSSGAAKIEVVVPAGFSEAKRLAFYRAMAVRNQLIELKMPAKNIDIAVREGSNGSDSSRVMVSPR